MALAPQQLDYIFGALADPTRRAILARLSSGEATVNELVAQSALSQPTISSHIKKLERAGLVTRSRTAHSRPVKLNAAPLASAAKWLGDYSRFWAQSLDQLDTLIQELKAKDSE